MNSPARYSSEVRDRAVRLVLEHQGEHDSQWSAIISVASKLSGARRRRYASGCAKPNATAGSVRGCAAMNASGRRSWSARTVSCAERTRSCARHRRICLPSADNNTAIRPSGARPPREMMLLFIDAYRGRYGVGPLCAQVPIAPSTYSTHKAREVEPERAPARVRRDGWLCGEIRRAGLAGRRRW